MQPQPRRSFRLEIYTDRGHWSSYIHHRQPEPQRHQEGARTASESFTTASAQHLLMPSSPSRLPLRPSADCWQLGAPKTSRAEDSVTLTACVSFLLPLFRHFGSSAFTSGCHKPLTAGSTGRQRAHARHFCPLSYLSLHRHRGRFGALLQSHRHGCLLFFLELCS